MLDPRLKVQSGTLGVSGIVQTVKCASDVQIAIDTLSTDNVDIVLQGSFLVFEDMVCYCVAVLFGVGAITDKGDGLAVASCMISALHCRKGEERSIRPRTVTSGSTARSFIRFEHDDPRHWLSGRQRLSIDVIARHGPTHATAHNDHVRRRGQFGCRAPCLELDIPLGEPERVEPILDGQDGFARF